MAEKSHLTLICPESTLESSVEWKKSGKVLKSGDAVNPKVFVGAFNTLYLVDVSGDEAGNYTCQVSKKVINGMGYWDSPSQFGVYIL